MRELDPRHRAVLLEEPIDSHPGFDVIVVIDATASWADAALWRYGGSFRNHQRGSTDCPSAQMDQVPIVCIAILARVLAHWGNAYAIAQRCRLQTEGIKKVRHRIALG
jgi:hypothetical protein